MAVNNFQGYLEEISKNSGIKFRLIGEEDTIYYDNIDKLEEKDKVSSVLYLGEYKAYIILDKKYEICIPLLQYTIENKYRELFSAKERYLIDLIEGEEIGKEHIDNFLPFLKKGATLILVDVQGNKYEALNIIKQLYNEEDVVSLVYGNSILLIGNFDEVYEHAKSIKDSIASDFYSSCHISFSDIVYRAEDIRKAYLDAKTTMDLGKRFDIKGEIYCCSNLILEKIVYNISTEMKKDLYESFCDKFNAFDGEIINTIEEFINSGLNISDASKRLYIHRNTLIYRLDKIYKDTGYDIRDFRQATVFFMAFLIWKENRQEM
ncbi:MAG: PucR family transcriptional regulator [Clostridiales bacterium]|nr:PucR family transcriptional regulator [Clostridiales bacterium]